jgi:exodeoxyribonuclease-1
MLFRYRARNYPQTLSEADIQRWQQYCREKLNDASKDGTLTLEQFTAKIAALRHELGADQQILKALADYAEERRLRFLN